MNVPIRSVAIAAAFSLRTASARADAGLPHFGGPDWSSLGTTQAIGAGVSLALGIASIGIWAARNPACGAALGSWIVALASGLVGVFGLLLGAGFSSIGWLVAGLLGLLVAGGAGYAGSRFARKGAFPGRDSGFLFTAALLMFAALAIVAASLDGARPPGPLN